MRNPYEDDESEPELYRYGVTLTNGYAFVVWAETEADVRDHVNQTVAQVEEIAPDDDYWPELAPGECGRDPEDDAYDTAVG